MNNKPPAMDASIPPSSPASSVAQDDLHRLVDGRLTPAEAAALQARLAADPEAAATRDAWQAQRDRLRQLHAPLLGEPVPATLLDAARRSEQARRQIDQWWRWGGMAAAVLLAFGIGWWSRGMAPTPAGVNLAQNLANSAGPRVFARQAVVAHAVYAPEVRHPVEVAAAQQEHLVQWLSKRLGRPLKLPQLAAQGYELVGGRLLPGDSGAVPAGANAARAQFMYQNAGGERITLYLGAVGATGAKASAPPPAMAQETAFSFFSDGPVPGFYWVDQGFGYALAGPLPREALLRLAQTVYQQLEAAADTAPPGPK
jgi:anti-sigma factor RsiW